MIGAPPLRPDRDQARAWAEQELRHPEYRAQGSGIIERMLHWIADHVPRLHTPSVTPPLGVAVIAAVVIAVVGIVLWRAGGVTRAARRPSGDLLGSSLRSADDHRAAAEAALAADDPDTAVLERFRALVRALADRDLVALHPGLTADEAAVEAGRHLPALADDLRTAARTFDDVLFGDLRATRDRAVELKDLDARAARVRLRPPAGVG